MWKKLFNSIILGLMTGIIVVSLCASFLFWKEDSNLFGILFFLVGVAGLTGFFYTLEKMFYEEKDKS